MTFWRNDGFEQPSVGGEEFSKPRLADGGIVRDKPVPRSGARIEPPIRRETEDDSCYWLEGFHRASGQWVKLARFEGEKAANKAITDCHSKTQPDREKLSIVWDDFSAFRAHLYVTVSWRGY